MFGRTTLSLLLGLLILATGQDVAQPQPNPITDFFSPDERITGGLRSVMDRIHKLDSTHTSCGHRQVCEAMTESVIERSDGELEFHRGFLRDIVDKSFDVVIDAVSPLLHMAGMGAFARREISFINFFINIVDSSLIWAGRVLAGRRFSRQLEGVGPLRAIMSALPEPPFNHLPHMVDLAVDLTGIFNRERGSFQYMRAGLMGYWKGGIEDDDGNGICNYLVEDGGCDSYWGIIPRINENKIGHTLRQGPTNPLANKPQYKFSGLEWKDLANPKYVLCKMDNYLSAIDGHVDPPKEEVVSEDLNDIVIVRKLPNESQEDMKIREEEVCLELMKTTEETNKDIDNEDISDEEGDYDYEEANSKEANTDKFGRYCQRVNNKEMKKFEKDEKKRMCKIILPKINTGSSNPLAFVQGIQFVGNNPLEPFISNSNLEDQADQEVANEDIVEVARSNINIDVLAKLHYKTVLVDKIEVNEDPMRDMVQALQIIKSLGIEDEEGIIEKVYRVTTRKGTGLLLQLDSTEYRDQILKQYRRDGIKKTMQAKLRRPKEKDLKQIASLITESL